MSKNSALWLTHAWPLSLSVKSENNTPMVQVDKRSHLVLFKQNQRNHDPYTSELQNSYKADYLVNRHNMVGTVSKLYVSNNTWIYVYIKKQISNSNSKSREFQLQFQLQLREFQLQLQLLQVSWISTPTPWVSTPIPTPANLQNINSNSGGFNSNSNSGVGVGVEPNSNSNSGVDPNPAQHVFQPALTGRLELISRKIVSSE